MNYAISILLGTLLISAVCFAADHTEIMSEPVVAANSGVTIGAPTALHLKSIGNGFQLHWTLSPQDPGIVTGYEIVRADVFSGPYKTVGVVAKGISIFTDKSAKPETIYFYKVRAISGDGCSRFSKEAAGELMARP